VGHRRLIGRSGRGSPESADRHCKNSGQEHPANLSIPDGDSAGAHMAGCDWLIRLGSVGRAESKPGDTQGSNYGHRFNHERYVKRSRSGKMLFRTVVRQFICSNGRIGERCGPGYALRWNLKICSRLAAGRNRWKRMKVIPTAIPDVLILEPRVFPDPRGFFKETYHRKRYAEAGVTSEFVQDNVSRSSRGILRGLHYQIEHPQGKLVQALEGRIFDVAVDVRKGSPTFGKWTGAELSVDNHRQMYIPPGFAHGFCVLSESADVFYKCTDYYYPEHERTLLWCDSQVGVQWPLEGEPLLSDKDRRGTSFGSLECFEYVPVR
jgi:dTDP-4-dehydrorhamnose 3,5-epimerase